MSEFFKEVIQRLNSNGTNQSLIDASKNFMIKSTKPKYSYNYFELSQQRAMNSTKHRAFPIRNFY